MPGLTSNTVVLTPDGREIGANYLWSTQEAAEEFLRSRAWRDTVADLTPEN